MNTKKKISSVCIHCSVDIVHFDGCIWHDSHLVFPQYCDTTPDNDGSRLHEPPPGVFHLAQDAMSQ